MHAAGTGLGCVVQRQGEAYISKDAWLLQGDVLGDKLTVDMTRCMGVRFRDTTRARRRNTQHGSDEAVEREAKTSDDS
jgi:hypothetical protein